MSCWFHNWICVDHVFKVHKIIDDDRFNTIDNSNPCYYSLEQCSKCGSQRGITKCYDMYFKKIVSPEKIKEKIESIRGKK